MYLTGLHSVILYTEGLEKQGGLFEFLPNVIKNNFLPLIAPM